MDIIRIALIGLLSTWLLASCTTVQPPKELPKNQSVTWDNRVGVLSNIQKWNLKGLISIRSSAKNNSWSANWQWQQARKTYTISLFGPMGSGSVILNGTPGQVTLDTSDGKQFTAPSAEDLLAQQLGWRLPVSHLYYWVRGLP